MTTTPRGFPVHPTRFWGGSGLCSHKMGVVPHHEAPHIIDVACDGTALAKCLCGMASPKDMWHCGEEGTVPFNYFLWKHMPTVPVDKYPINTNMSVKGEQVRGCMIVIKLDSAPSNNASPIDITQEDLDAFVAAHPPVVEDN